MRKLSPSGCLNAWTRIKKFNGTNRLSNFWNFFGAIEMICCRARLVTMEETWLYSYHYDPETKQQSVEWRHSGSPSPQKFRVQKLDGKVLAWIFWDEDDVLLFDYLPKGQTINAECNWRTFWRKNAAGKSPRGSCSCTTMSRPTGQLEPRRNWLTWTSIVLITHPILGIWPRRTTTCSLDWKNNWKVAIYQRSRLKEQSSISPLVVSCISLHFTAFLMHSLLFCVLLIFAHIYGRHRSSDANLACSEPTKNIQRESEIIVFIQVNTHFETRGPRKMLDISEICVCVCMLYTVFFTINCFWETLWRLMTINTTASLYSRVLYSTFVYLFTCTSLCPINKGGLIQSPNVQRRCSINCDFKFVHGEYEPFQSLWIVIWALCS